MSENKELSYFKYEDWDIGTDNKLRIGDYIRCIFQHPYNGEANIIEGRIVKHFENDMPVIEFGDHFLSIQQLWLDGYEFARIKKYISI